MDANLTISDKSSDEKLDVKKFNEREFNKRSKDAGGNREIVKICIEKLFGNSSLDDYELEDDETLQSFYTKLEIIQNKLNELNKIIVSAEKNTTKNNAKVQWASFFIIQNKIGKIIKDLQKKECNKKKSKKDDSKKVESKKDDSSDNVKNKKTVKNKKNSKKKSK